MKLKFLNSFMQPKHRNIYEPRVIYIHKYLKTYFMLPRITFYLCKGWCKQQQQDGGDNVVCIFTFKDWHQANIVYFDCVFAPKIM